MGQNPLNLALRFLLEMGALAALAYWGWTQHTGALRYALAFGMPLLAAVLWGVFRAPGDASSGAGVVAIPGPLRLLLELALFAAATWCLAQAGAVTLAWVFGGLVLLHYVLSWDRVAWLLGRQRPL